MSTVNAIVYVNPIEPGPLSLRIPSGVETRLDLAFFDQLSTPINTDLLAQIELTGRSRPGPPVWYAAPATDIVNGKARAVFPADALDDPNGYRLRLYGTVNGEGMLLATGVVDVTLAVGRTATPLDIIDSIDLTLTRGEDALLDVTLWADAGGSVPLDLNNATISATVYASKGGVGIVPFTVTPIATNVVRLSLTEDQVNALPDACWWSLVAAGAGGLITLAEGNVVVTGTADVPLPVTTDDWEYLTPATADEPLAGQIVQPDIAQNILRIHTTSQPGNDQTTLLGMLKPNDRITIGATTWIVQGTFYNTTGWFEVLVTPIIQDAVTGVAPVLFEPPR